MSDYCEKCKVSTNGDAYCHYPNTYDLVFIVDPFPDTSFTQRLIAMAVDRVPPTYRKINYAVAPIIPCKSEKVPVLLYRSCAKATGIFEYVDAGVLPVLCGKSVQKIMLGHTPNQRSCAGWVVDSDGVEIGLLPGIQDIHDVDMEDQNDWFNIFADGVKTIFTKVYRAKTDQSV